MAKDSKQSKDSKQPKEKKSLGKKIGDFLTGKDSEEKTPPVTETPAPVVETPVVETSVAETPTVEIPAEVPVVVPPVFVATTEYVPSAAELRNPNRPKHL